MRDRVCKILENVKVKKKIIIRKKMRIVSRKISVYTVN